MTIWPTSTDWWIYGLSAYGMVITILSLWSNDLRSKAMAQLTAIRREMERKEQVYQARIDNHRKRRDEAIRWYCAEIVDLLAQLEAKDQPRGAHGRFVKREVVG